VLDTTRRLHPDADVEQDIDPCKCSLADLLRSLGYTPDPARDSRPDDDGIDPTPYAWDDGDADQDWMDTDRAPPDVRGGAGAGRPRAGQSPGAPDDDEDCGEHAWIGNMRCRVCNDVPPGESDAEAALRVAWALAGGNDPVIGLVAETVATSYVKFAGAARDAERAGHRMADASAAVGSFVRMARRMRGKLLEFVRNAWAFEVTRGREPSAKSLPLPGWARQNVPDREPIDRMSDDFDAMRALLLGDVEPGRFTVITALRRMRRAAWVLFNMATHLGPPELGQDGFLKRPRDHARLAVALRDLFEVHAGSVRAEQDFRELHASIARPVKVSCVVVEPKREVPPVTEGRPLLPAAAESGKSGGEEAA
jgi:hypothetical protein